MDIKNFVKTYFEQIDWNLEPKNLYEPIDYALQSGGKRIRPTLVLMAAKLFGGDVEKCIKPAAAMEIFHNFTLLHDDVMDIRCGNHVEFILRVKHLQSIGRYVNCR